MATLFLWLKKKTPEQHPRSCNERPGPGFRRVKPAGFLGEGDDVTLLLPSYIYLEPQRPRFLKVGFPPENKAEIPIKTRCHLGSRYINIHRDLLGEAILLRIPI